MNKKESFELEEVSIRLVKEKVVKERYKINKPEDAINYVADKIRMLDREVVCVINLKSSGEPINFSIVSMGILNEALVNPRELLKTSILSNASNIIMLHNHPSGNLTPSSADIKLTDRLIQVCDLVSIPLLDHIIVGPELEDEYYSFEAKSRIKHRSTITDDIDKISFSHKKAAEPNVIDKYRDKTKELFHPINGIYAHNFEDTVYHYINSLLEDYSPSTEIVDVVLVGSRSRGIENNNSDMDFVFEYIGEMKEYEMFNLLNKSDFTLAGIKIDINPIRKEETGTLEEYLPKTELFLQKKAENIRDELLNRFKNIMRTHGYPLLGDGFISFPEEYEDVFTKEELKELEKIILNQNKTMDITMEKTSTKEEVIQYMSKDNPISVWVGNLRKYNEGSLEGKWIELPMTDEELNKELDEISLNGKDEIMIFDQETREDCQYMHGVIHEFDNIHELNVVAKLIGIEPHPAVEMYLKYDENLSLSEIANLIYKEDEISYSPYEFEGVDNPNVLNVLSNEEKLGYTILESNKSLTATLNGLDIEGTSIMNYINVEAIGRDMVLSGYITVGEDGFLDSRHITIDLEEYSIEEINQEVNNHVKMEKQQNQEVTLKTKHISEPTLVGPKL